MNKPLRQLLGRLLSGLTRGTPTHPTPQHEKRPQCRPAATQRSITTG